MTGKKWKDVLHFKRVPLVLQQAVQNTLVQGEVDTQKEDEEIMVTLVTLVGKKNETKRQR